jgi:hypothetical protein
VTRLDHAQCVCQFSRWPCPPCSRGRAVPGSRLARPSDFSMEGLFVSSSTSSATSRPSVARPRAPLQGRLMRMHRTHFFLRPRRRAFRPAATRLRSGRAALDGRIDGETSHVMDLASFQCASNVHVRSPGTTLPWYGVLHEWGIAPTTRAVPFLVPAASGLRLEPSRQPA